MAGPGLARNRDGASDSQTATSDERQELTDVDIDRLPATLIDQFLRVKLRRWLN